jgi:aspartate racemase
MMRDCAAGVLLATPDMAPRVPSGTARLIYLEPISHNAQEEIGTCPAPEAGPGDTSHIFYTSGSTGVPKGVMISHRGIVRLVLAGGFMDFGPQDSFLQAAPISFDASTLEIWMPLLHGGQIVLTGTSGTSLPAIARAVREQGVTCLWLTAGLFQTMVDEHPDDLKGLRYLLAGGDVLSPSHVRRALEKLPGTTLINGYGPTENTTFTCCHTITSKDTIRHSVPIGKPIGNTSVHLLDAHLRPVPIGIPGELFTGGDGLALGYWNQPERTAEHFVTTPQSDRLLYRTGDLCRWLPDGTIEFLGRCDDQVKVRGFRIEPGEIEAALASHPSVKQAKATARGDNAENKRILAWVVPAGNQRPDPATLTAYLASRLPAYMRPDAIGVLDSLPLSANGKINTSSLPDPSQPSSAGQKHIFAVPEGETEARLAALWNDLLGMEAISRDDDFFAIGGHSLMALRLFSRIEREFHRAIPLSSLIHHPTIRSLATLLGPEIRTASKQGENIPLQPTTPGKGNFVALSNQGSQPPLICIHGGDGGILFYRELASLMTGDFPIHAIESLDLGNSGKIEPASVEETATAYVHDLLARYPNGPFRLAGYSFGGVVAHEMACQLESMGYPVEFLGLFDTHNLAASHRAYSPPERFRIFWNQTRDLPFSGRIGQLFDRIIEGIHTNRRVRADLKEAATHGPAAAHSDIRRVQVREENWRAMQAYRPRPFGGRITLFKAIIDSDKVEWPADYGWSSVSRGGIDIIPIPGRHLTLFDSGHVLTLAMELKTSISRSSHANRGAHPEKTP